MRFTLVICGVNLDVDDLVLFDKCDLAEVIRRLRGVDGRFALPAKDVDLSLIPSFCTCSSGSNDGWTTLLNKTSSRGSSEKRHGENMILFKLTLGVNVP